MAKEYIDIEKLLYPLNLSKSKNLLLEDKPQIESTTVKTEQFAGKLGAKRRLDESENIGSKIESKTFKGMRTKEADKKIRSELYLALGKKGKRFLAQRFSKFKLFWISLAEPWDFLNQNFIRKSNVTPKRHKLRQKNRDSARKR